MPVVEVVDALQVIAQLIPLIQGAMAKGQTTITQAEFDAAVGPRNVALAKLDADIAAAIAARTAAATAGK